MCVMICSRQILPTLRCISRDSVDTALFEWVFTIVRWVLKSRKGFSGSGLEATRSTIRFFASNRLRGRYDSLVGPIPFRAVL